VIDADAVSAFLEALLDDPTRLVALPEDQRRRLLTAAGRIARPEPKDKKALHTAARRLARAEKRDADEALLSRTQIRKLRENPLFQTPRHNPGSAPPLLLGHTQVARPCYCCRRDITEVHGFYDQLCVPCGDKNFARRHPSVDLSGRIALLSGGRVKIGFQAGVMLLRAGCRLIVTTRFPHDAARRYAELPDFADFADRIEFVGIDLRQPGAVEGLAGDLLERLPRLDYLINSACQTVRRPPGFYGHLLAGETVHPTLSDSVAALVKASPRRDRAMTSAELTQVALLPDDHLGSDTLFPTGRYDADEQQVDLREVNSWRLELDQVSTIELLEVHLVNTVAPCILNARLKPLLARVPTRDAHIVNVSAMEGQFYRIFKTSKHPHTNMAKAALNMMTRTASLEYVEHGIHMNSVDTGWVTDEDPAVLAERKKIEQRFHPPLDIVDGAARIIDPIVQGVTTGVHGWGQFLKDYEVTDW
jgi:NAD(P)-dependent dehydrogenase (short-subunit alcohol dehydrogenase family)